MSRQPAMFDREINGQHLEELIFLLEHRQQALFSRDFTPRDVEELGGRIEAHVDGLLVAGCSVDQLLDEAFASGEELPAHAAAVALLRRRDPVAVARVMDQLLESQGAGIHGICGGACDAGIDLIKVRLADMSRTGDPQHAAAAAETLAYHEPLTLTAIPLMEFCRHDQVEVRCCGWRTAAAIGATSAPFDVGFADEFSCVRRMSLFAATWLRLPVLLVHVREATRRLARHDLEAIRMLAVLGQPADLPLIQNILGEGTHGPQFRELLIAAAGTFGHPALIPDLLATMTQPNVRLVVAAARAFTRMTGLKIHSDTRTKMPSEDGTEADEFKEEFLEEVFLPDVDQARRKWSQVESRFREGTRWSQGLNLSEFPDRASLSQLNMSTLWEVQLRGRFHGVREPTMLDTPFVNDQRMNLR